MRSRALLPSICRVEVEPVLHRDEVTGIFFVITDISANVKKIAQLLEEMTDGEDSEDDA